MNVNLELLFIGVSLITTLIGFGWRMGKCLNDIKISVTKIETLLAAQAARMDRIEKDIQALETDVKVLQKQINWK